MSNMTKKYKELEMNGKVTDLTQFDHFRVTGVYAYGTRRFKPVVTEYIVHALGINLWRGTVWGVRPDGTRKKLKEVWN